MMFARSENLEEFSLERTYEIMCAKDSYARSGPGELIFRIGFTFLFSNSKLCRILLANLVIPSKSLW